MNKYQFTEVTFLKRLMAANVVPLTYFEILLGQLQGAGTLGLPCMDLPQRWHLLHSSEATVEMRDRKSVV